MDIINNRYRVIEKIKQNRFFSSYVVSDIMNNHKIMQINILDSEYIPKELVEFYIRNFMKLTNIQSSNVAKVYNFGLVYLVDNKKLSHKRHYFTNEYFGDKYSLVEVVRELDKDGILDLFIEICKGTNYLHLKGFIYGSMNLNNINAWNNGDGCAITFQDIATIKMESYTSENRQVELYFRAPELVDDNEPTVYSDIYSLGVMLLWLAKKGFVNYNNLNSDVKSLTTFDGIISNNEYEVFLGKISKIIKKMIRSNPRDRYKSVYEVVEDINKTFGKEYKAHKREELEKLNLNLDIVGRDEELNKVMDIYESMELLKSKNNMILIHGETGIGKTRLLRSINYLFTLKKANIYSSFLLDMSSKNKARALIDILKTVISECDPKIVEKYEAELVKFIPELTKKKEIVPSEPLGGEKERLRLINRVAGFLTDFAKNKLVVFLIDNIHLADDFTIDLVKYLFNLDNNNIMIILSYCDGECVLNKKFVSMLNHFNSNFNVRKIFLDGLGSKETVEMIKEILGMDKMPYKLASKVHEKSHGNPLFIQEIIKDIFTKKIIYINDDNGMWYKEVDYDELPIPSDMQGALLNQIKEIPQVSYEILAVIAIFHNPISLDIIIKFLSYDANYIEEIIEGLLANGILCRNIEDRGFAFDFYNKFLKNIIYEKTNNEYKIDKHRLAADLLKEQYENGREEYLDELIYHLQKSGQKYEIVNYCIKNAMKMLKLKNRNDAILNIEKALATYNDYNDSKKIEILSLLAETYFEDENFKAAMSKYKELRELAHELEKYEYEIDALNNMANIEFLNGSFEKCEAYVNESEELLNNIHYLKGYYEYAYRKTTMCLVQQKYDEALDICEKCLRNFDDNFLKSKAMFYNALGNVYMQTTKVEKAIKSYINSLEIFNNIDYQKGKVKALNNIGVIYGDFYQDDESALSYFTKVKEICEQNKIISDLAMSLSNIAYVHIQRGDFNLALENLEEAVGKYKDNITQSEILYAYSLMAIANLKLNRYREADTYYKLCKAMIKDDAYESRNFGEYYTIMAEVNCGFGNINKAEKYINLALKSYEYEESVLKWNSQVIREYIIFIKNKAVNRSIACKAINNIKHITKKFIRLESKLDVMLNISINLIDDDGLKDCSKLFEYLNDNKEQVSNLRNKAKYLFVEAMLQSDINYKLKLLTEALDISKENKDNETGWRIYLAIGDYYWSNKEHYNALVYYFESCEIIKDLLSSIPKSYRVSYANTYGIGRVVEKFIKAKNLIEFNDTNEDFKLSIYNNNDIDMLFKQVNYKDIIRDKAFVNAVRKLYNTAFPIEVQEINDIIRMLESDDIENLNLLNKYLSYITLASKSLIIIDNEDNYDIVSITSGGKKLEDIKPILDKVKNTKEIEFLCITNNNYKKSKMTPYNIKTYMCIPIMSSNTSSKLPKDRRRDGVNSGIVVGYIYIESDRVLNNFNEESIQECYEISKLIGIILEKLKLKVNASIDKLTGALTRKYLEASLKENLERANRSGESFSIIMFDLDHFKGINDKFGHQTGDYVLSTVCNVVRDNIRHTDILGRYGGEEFVVILPNTDSNDAINVAEKLRMKIKAANILEDKREVTVSMGISSYPQHGQWQKELIEKADQALYGAKEAGRNRCNVWKSEYSNKVKRINKLSGIVSGNIVQDERNVLTMVELINLINEPLQREEKIYKLLGRIIETTESEKGMLLCIQDNCISDKYGRKIFDSEWIEVLDYNEKIVNSVIDNHQGVYTIDWDNVIEYDEITGFPDWKSIIVVPIVDSGNIKAVLYLSVSTQKKEFSYDDFNFINILSQLAVPII